jgi:hypothetical protein
MRGLSKSRSQHIGAQPLTCSIEMTLVAGHVELATAGIKKLFTIVIGF